MSDLILPPPPIWKIIFRYVAADSRAYLIPLRCVCRAWADLARVERVKFLNPLTRLLTVSARDRHARLCIWAHERGGFAKQTVLLAAAQSGDIGIVRLVCDWSRGEWGESLDEYVLDHSTRIFCWGSTESRIIVSEMLEIAAEIEADEVCRYLIKVSSTLDLDGMFHGAMKVDSVHMFRMAEESFKERGEWCIDEDVITARRGLQIKTSAKYGSFKLIEYLKSCSSSDRFWEKVLIGAATGGCLEMYNYAKRHLSDPMDSALVDGAAHTALRSGRNETMSQLITDGADLRFIEDFALGHRLPELGRIVLAAGGNVITKREIEEWELDRGKRRRVIPLYLGEEGGYLSD